jgi:hypothetical protein
MQNRRSEIPTILSSRMLRPFGTCNLQGCKRFTGNLCNFCREKICSVVLAHLDDLNYEVSNFVLAVGSSDLI